MSTDINSNIAKLRDTSPLDKKSFIALKETQMEKDPFTQFAIWFEEALHANIIEPYTMVLATATPDGKPSARMVLLKTIDKKGLTFFTNYQSRKGKQLGKNNNVAVIFYWQQLNKQVRIEGVAQKLSQKESDLYFATRPAQSKINAWASPQSQVIENRDYLEQQVEQFVEKFKGKSVTRPPYWGGYRITPTFFEFWLRRPNRLHDRITYTRIKNVWTIRRLAP